MHAIPLQRSVPRPSPGDDAYLAWLNAQQRFFAALCACGAAPAAGRADARGAHLVELPPERMAAGALARLHRQRLAA